MSAEAALRPNLRCVREKTQDQLDLQALHRVTALDPATSRRPDKIGVCREIRGALLSIRIGAIPES